MPGDRAHQHRDVVQEPAGGPGGRGFKDVDIELEDNPRYRWIYPEQAGAVVVRAIKRGDLYALTHPDWYPKVAARHEAIADAFAEQAADAGLGR